MNYRACIVPTAKAIRLTTMVSEEATDTAVVSGHP